MAIQFRGQKHRVEVAVSSHLRHPMILGTNWAVAQIEEAEPGPMGAETGELSAVVRRNLTESDEFPLE